jgi:hypothetical protein
MRSIDWLEACRISTVAGSVMALTCLGAAATQARARVQVSDPRPLAAVILELETRHGRVVTYEDPVRVHTTDIADITSTVPPARRARPTIVIPKGGHFTFEYDPPSDQSDNSTTGMLQTLVRQFNLTSADAQFRVMRTGETYHVLPAASRDISGVRRTSVSPLDTIISIPDGTRTGLEQLWEIRSALRESGFATFSLGIVPMTALRGHLDGVVRKESARNAIVRVLNSSQHKLSYAMNCDAGPTPTCVLNIHPLTAPTK